MRYRTSGVCSQAIEFEITDDKKVIRRLEGIHCGPHPTSCPDQLSKAIKEALA